MRLLKHLSVIGAIAAVTLTLSLVSRAQVVQGLTTGDRQFLDGGLSLYELQLEHRGLRLEVRMHTWGLSAPGFTVDVWNDDPQAAEFFDVVTSQGTVTIDGQVAGFVSYGPTVEHPWGGRRAIILPSWSTWPAAPFNGRDLEFELHDPADPSSRVFASIDNVQG